MPLDFNLTLVIYLVSYSRVRYKDTEIYIRRDRVIIDPHIIGFIRIWG